MRSVQAQIEDHIKACLLLKHKSRLLQKISKVISSSFKSGGKLILCGNGGSAADSQHVAAEFVGKFLKWRRPLPAMALSSNSSVITALGNDIGQEDIFARQINAFANPGDVVAGITTSGLSPNVLFALQQAQNSGCVTVAFTGIRKIDSVDFCLSVSSKSTPRIQEVHMLAWHIICGAVENEF